MPSVYRPALARVSAAAVSALCVIGLILATVQDGVDVGWRAGPWVLLVLVAAWAMYWRPSVTVGDAGVRLVNVVRTIDVPWPSLERLEIKGALLLVTTRARYAAWAAPAPGGLATMRAAHRAAAGQQAQTTERMQQPANPRGIPAAEGIRHRWAEWRHAVESEIPAATDPAESEMPAATVPSARWHWPVIVAVPAVVALGVMADLLV